MFVIFGHMIDQSGLPAVRLGAAQLLSRNLLTCRGFHQRRAGKEDRSLIAHNHGLVRHGRNIRPARSAASHDASDLENALCAHLRLIVEDAAEMLAVRKNLCLIRQVRPTRINQINAWQPIFLTASIRSEEHTSELQSLMRISYAVF